MTVKNTPTIGMIPVDQINIMNPRYRNPKLFEGIVQNIAKVGLKRPITVTACHSKTGGKDYDLVCGQGRLEAFMACGQKMIPAMIIDASEEKALIMSLVENVARRKHRAMDLLQGVEILLRQGYNAKAIAAKIGHSTDYINNIITLLEQGEERLVAAVESGNIPIMLAINIASSPKNEQEVLQEAYEKGHLSGSKFMAAKRLFEDRRRAGKTLRGARSKTHSGNNVSDFGQNIIRTYKREVARKQLVERKADLVNNRLMFLKEAMRSLMQQEHFTTLLRAESLDTMPKQLATLISGK
ncbi:MAG: plasmid partitioning protein RepB C-terminal domain-containing protein [Pseudomonadota bacterium]